MSDSGTVQISIADESTSAIDSLPSSTYRLQLHANFTLEHARQIIPYLKRLGISHVYTSSLLTARPGSKHGYDVTDHSQINPEIGTEAEFQQFVTELHSHGLKLLLDTVPNHMAVGASNAWWFDVLENGPSSPFAEYFDIAWYDSPRQQLRGKLLLPVLSDSYGEVFESRQIDIAREAGSFTIRYGSNRLPVDPRTFGLLLQPLLDSGKDQLDSDEVIELQSILTAVRHLPSREERERSDEARNEIAVIKRRLAELFEKSSQARAQLDAILQQISADLVALENLLDAQAYRLCFWRVASDEINYRRFFDVNDLAALSVERPEVFAATHQKILDWVNSGKVAGLRIDHPDGLFDPKQYLERLQEATASAHEQHSLYVVVEKILAHRERLPDNWRCAGTTGYEFAAAVNGLFVDGANETAISQTYQDFTGLDEPFSELVYRNKFLILQTSLSSELHMLAYQLDRIAQASRWSRDFTLNGLRHALREVIACFPVYRTYINDAVQDADRLIVLRAIRRARAKNAILGRRVFDFIRDTLLLKDPPAGPPSEEYRLAQRSFAGKFQQVTSPVMAKGFEDTAMYVYNRLVSLNEVGGEPDRFGWSSEDIHAYFQERSERSPGGLSPLSTHDTKRSEDVRARINLLSEVPKSWSASLNKWSEWNRRHKVEVEEGAIAPDANEEYFLYQTLLGVWPFEPVTSNFLQRIQAYMCKALHEAKVHSSWINPDAEYDNAVQQFVARILDPDQSPDFLSDFQVYQQQLSRWGIWNSLSQTLIGCTAPGVPDTYQGTELWDLSLVDPDNRREVDYAKRSQALDELDQEGDPRLLCQSLLSNPSDGRIKLFVTSRALRFRQTSSTLMHGHYQSIRVTGPLANHVFAYLRFKDDQAVLVAVPRLVSRLEMVNNSIDAPQWRGTILILPDSFQNFGWRNEFTGNVSNAAKQIDLAELWEDFPLALLRTQQKVGI